MTIDPITSSAPIRVILDTSLFVNPDTQKYFGKDIEQAIKQFLLLARKNHLGVYMPVSVFRELSHFAPEKVLTHFRREASVRAPDIHNLNVPAAIFHSFIGDLRGRINQGLRIAEDAVRSENIPDNIHRIREHYRTALRNGIIDSVEDLDVVLLAKEIHGCILSADEGIAKMAEELGIEILSAADFRNRYAPKKKAKP